MRILAVTGTELFLAEPAGPAQVVAVEVECPAGELRIAVAGEVVAGEVVVVAADGRQTVEVPVACSDPPGTTHPIRVSAVAGGDEAVTESQFVVAEPGWTVWMVSHFHYDPVWWNTQAAYTATWDREGQDGRVFRRDWQHTGFDLVRLHLETARRDPDYKFVLAELDYLKPYWDTFPRDRAYLRSLLAQGRLELMGGTYNEPNTNLTSAESTIRNLMYGVGFQREVIGGDPRTAWQLDAFGHDPQFPGLVADAGLDSSSWARGPFHQWGPMLWTHEPRGEGWGDPAVMQFSSEFEWLSPSGKGVLTHYMPAHYSAGWQIDAKPTLAAAEQGVYDLFVLLKRVAATRNVLLPVGTDYTPPAKWITEIHRDWNERYVWPRFVCGLPREFFAAVRAELDRGGARPSPQTRDMNPVYTGKDVSYIDTKQAQRHAEARLVDAEIFATIAAAHGARYPHATLDKAWRQLVYGAHHDAITGTESDQVYLDLLTGWREAYDLADGVLGQSLRQLTADLETAGADLRVVVFNPSAWARTDLVRVRVDFPEAGSYGVNMGDLPVVLEHADRHPDGSLASVDVLFVAADVPSVGYRTFWIAGTPVASVAGWLAVDGVTTISNEAYRLSVDPRRGGCVSRLADVRTNRELLQPGRVGNELLVYDEYAAHPRFHEGPWHLLPKGGPVHASAAAPAGAVLVERSPLGERVTVTGAVGPMRYTQQLTLWYGIDRLDATTRIDDFTGVDQLVRLRWPAAVDGALPVSEVGNAVVGRGFGLIDVDSEQSPWTLDNPAQNWFALSSTARIDIHDETGARVHRRAIGIAEIVTPLVPVAPVVRELAVALVRQGVTATTSAAVGPRYGSLAVDSNLPDVRIAVGGPDINAFTAHVLAGVAPGYAAELRRQLAATGRARLWVPAEKPLRDVWLPDADLTGIRALPVLILAGDDAVRELCTDLDRGAVTVHQPAARSDEPDPDLDDYTVGLVNRGMPGFAVDTTGALHLSLLRSCTGWPSGVWIDPPTRTAPDGSAFQQQHWTHSFDYAIVAGAGDWRAAGMVAHGHAVNHPLVPSVIAGGPAAARSYVGVTSTVDAAEGGPGQVVLAALKPTGNPIANGRLPASTMDNVTVRLYEAAGRRTRVDLRLWAQASRAVEVNILDEPLGHAELDPTDLVLAGASISQLRLGVHPAPVTEPDSAAVTRVYSRYWLHNEGPAPIGNLPVAVHLDPPHAAVEGSVTLTLTVASDLTEDRAVGVVSIVGPDGWQCTPDKLPYDLEPGGHLEQCVSVTGPPGVAAGVYWVRAQIDSGGQVVEDVARLSVGGAAPETITVSSSDEALRLRPGQSATIELELHSDAASAVTAQVHLVSPWHTWDLFPDANIGVEIPAASKVRLRLPVRVPPDHGPGRWWVLAKVAHAGLLQYTQPIDVEVLA
jgi:alpha-mannosidase